MSDDREPPCPICRRSIWRYAINDALGLAEPYMGDALERAVASIRYLRERERVANETPGLSATLDETRAVIAAKDKRIAELEAALRKCLTVLEPEVGWSGSAGNWQLESAVAESRRALGLDAQPEGGT